jgi:hypothetical protein
MSMSGILQRLPRAATRRPCRLHPRLSCSIMLLRCMHHFIPTSEGSFSIGVAGVNIGLALLWGAGGPGWKLVNLVHLEKWLGQLTH